MIKLILILSWYYKSDYRKRRLIVSLLIFSFKVFRFNLYILYFTWYVLSIIFMT